MKIKDQRNCVQIRDQYIRCGKRLILKILIFNILIIILTRTDKVLSYQKTLLSGKKSAKIQEIKDQFNNVTDENAIILNNRLEEIERYNNSI